MAAQSDEEAASSVELSVSTLLTEESAQDVSSQVISDPIIHESN